MKKNIGLIDSGVGGLSILNNLLDKDFNNFFYIADTKFMPYGSQSIDVIIDRTEKMINYLINECGVDFIVIACHTISAVALEKIQKKYEKIIFFDLLKLTIIKAVQITKNNEICVLATPASISSHRHKNLLLSLNQKLNIIEQPCDNLAYLIEHNSSDDEINQCLQKYINNILKQSIKIDTIILGCTHYDHIKNNISLFFPNASIVSADTEISNYNFLKIDSNKIQEINIFETGINNNLKLFYLKHYKNNPIFKIINL